MPLSTIYLALLAITAGNLIAFGLFWLDKERARAGGWRVSESALLLAVLYGGFGAWMGQQLLRHKTRKEPFRSWLGVLLSLYALALLAVAIIVVVLPVLAA